MPSRTPGSCSLFSLSRSKVLKLVEAHSTIWRPAATLQNKQNLENLTLYFRGTRTPDVSKGSVTRTRIVDPKELAKIIRKLNINKAAGVRGCLTSLFLYFLFICIVFGLFNVLVVRVSCSS